MLILVRILEASLLPPVYSFWCYKEGENVDQKNNFLNKIVTYFRRLVNIVQLITRSNANKAVLFGLFGGRFIRFRWNNKNASHQNILTLYVSVVSQRRSAFIPKHSVAKTKT